MRDVRILCWIVYTVSISILLFFCLLFNEEKINKNIEYESIRLRLACGKACISVDGPTASEVNNFRRVKTAWYRGRQ